jgi:hypothetical protein
LPFIAQSSSSIIIIIIIVTMRYGPELEDRTAERGEHIAMVTRYYTIGFLSYGFSDI